METVYSLTKKERDRLIDKKIYDLQAQIEIHENEIKKLQKKIEQLSKY